MILVIIIAGTVNAFIWFGIKRGISHYIQEHARQCHAVVPLESPERQPKRLAGRPWEE